MFSIASCLFAGTNTLVMNLISSFSDDMNDDSEEAEEEEKDRRRKMSLHPRRGSVFSVISDRDYRATDKGESKSPDSAAAGAMTGQLPGIAAVAAAAVAGSNADKEEKAAPKKKKDDWISEYQAGCDWEIYNTALDDVFIGVKFADLAYVIYQRLGVVVFGIQIKDLNTNQTRVSGAQSALLISSVLGLVSMLR
jgi:hypothetical protein